MSEPPTEGRRPRPRPQPAPAAPPPEPGAPEPGTPEPELPAALATPRKRSERRQAQKRVDKRSRQRRLRLIIIGATAVAVLAGAASVIVALTRSDGGKPRTTPSPSGSVPRAAGAQFADADVASAFMAAATSDVTAVTTYDYRRLDDALTAGLAVTTGTYRSAYRQALTGTLADTAKADHVVQDFQVLDAGIGEITADKRQAKVLVFGRQVTTDRTSTDGSKAGLVTLCATIRREGERYLISDLSQDASAGLPPGSPDLAAAAEAARAEVVNLLTYSRGQFDADLRRSLAGAVDPLRRQIQQNAEATRAAMTKGKYDLSGVVTAVGVKNATGAAATMLVAADASRLGDSPAAGGVTPMRYVVTVTNSSGSWAAAQVTTLTSG